MEDHSPPAVEMPETEVSSDPTAPSAKRSAPQKATRRTFTLRYKRDIIEQYYRLDAAGRGALLRREGLYSSHITKWRRLVESSDNNANTAPARRAAQAAANEQIAQLTAQLEQARQIIAAQKKLSDLLFANSLDHNDESSK